MQWVTGLKGDDIGIAKLLETRPRLRRGETQSLEVIVFWQLQYLELPGDVELAPAMHLCHQWMA